MVREYQRQHDRLELLTRYKAILTHSRHMVDEYAAHGLRVQQIALPIGPAEENFELLARSTTALEDAEHLSHPRTPWRLLFVGRTLSGWPRQPLSVRPSNSNRHPVARSAAVSSLGRAAAGGMVCRTAARVATTTPFAITA